MLKTKFQAWVYLLTVFPALIWLTRRDPIVSGAMFGAFLAFSFVMLIISFGGRGDK